mmetsp:Transcript_37721/g.117235  ORF Transcript_37721/g.117235 Transcript_37721/m.117235 type:complete len:201 (-) Transcript_37721:437-1039(-)
MGNTRSKAQPQTAPGRRPSGCLKMQSLRRQSRPKRQTLLCNFSFATLASSGSGCRSRQLSPQWHLPRMKGMHRPASLPFPPQPLPALRSAQPRLRLLAAQRWPLRLLPRLRLPRPRESRLRVARSRPRPLRESGLRLEEAEQQARPRLELRGSSLLQTRSSSLLLRPLPSFALASSSSASSAVEALAPLPWAAAAAAAAR